MGCAQKSCRSVLLFLPIILLFVATGCIRGNVATPLESVVSDLPIVASDDERTAVSENAAVASIPEVAESQRNSALKVDVNDTEFFSRKLQILEQSMTRQLEEFALLSDIENLRLRLSSLERGAAVVTVPPSPVSTETSDPRVRAHGDAIDALRRDVDALIARVDASAASAATATNTPVDTDTRSTSFHQCLQNTGNARYATFQMFQDAWSRCVLYLK